MPRLQSRAPMLLGTGGKGGRMTKFERIKQALDWQGEDRNRHVAINIGSPWDNDDFSVWCYDYALSMGQYVKDGEEINIPKVKQDKEKAEFERLKTKFEGEKND